MTKLREAATLALEALEILAQPTKTNSETPRYKAHKAAIVALRNALAEPEQEPVAWRYELSTAIFESGEYSGWRCTISEKEPCAPENSIRNLQPLYTHPPQRKPLTDEEILSDEVLRYYFGCNGGAGPVSQKGIKIVRAVERAHGIGGEA